MNTKGNSPYFWAKTVDGKPGISVRDHCLNVGCVAAAILEKLPASFTERPLAVWLASSHDIGKISPGFQRKCEAWLLEQDLVAQAHTQAWVRAEPDHSKVSQFTLQHLLRQQFPISKAHAALWAAVAGMHHGRLHWRGEWNPADRSGTQVGDSWDQNRRELAAQLAELLGDPTYPPHVELDDMSRLWWTAGLITVADWIGSDEDYFSPLRSDNPANITTVQTVAHGAVKRIGMEAHSLTSARSFHELFGFLPNELQATAMETICEPGVYAIEAPMGMGKTEAALALAHKLIISGQASGLYFALPTQATSNRIHERVAEFLQRSETTAPRLIHSGSWLLDQTMHFPAFVATQPGEQRATARDWFASSKRALIAPFGVGTVDQALLGVIAVKHFFLRHYALAGKVVILDEVHSYDVYTGTLIEALISALRKLRCTVIILSATLTRERRKKLLGIMGNAQHAQSSEVTSGHDAFPLITGVTSGGVMLERAVAAPVSKPPVAVRFRAEVDILNEAVEAARSGSCVLWICNTVDRAIATYHALCSERQEGDPPVGLLHSRFPFYRRQELEGDWMCKLGKDRSHRPPGCLLISTQIVEQSVDLDADLLITELAPTDMLFQRLGRLWRHQQPSNVSRPCAQPEIWISQEDIALDLLRNESDRQIICQALGKKAKVYAPYVLLRTLEQWHDKSHVHLPADIRPWLEATYQPLAEAERPSWKQLLAELEKRRSKHIGQAETAQNLWNLPALQDEEGIGTRLNECPTLPLILVKAVNETSVTPLDGPPIPVQSLRFDYQTAKALHWNAVKAPTWWFANKSLCLKSVPTNVAAMVALHMHGLVEIAVIDGTSINLESLGPGSLLDFTHDRGLSRKVNSATTTNWNEDNDESYD